MSPTPTTRTRVRLAPHERRLQIVDAAVSLISQRGFWGVTFASLAAEVGVTVQGILHHFPQKTDVLLAVLDRFDEMGRELMYSPSPVGEVHHASDFVLGMGNVVRRNAEQPELVQLYVVLSAESLSDKHPAHEYFDHRQRLAITTIEEMASGWHEQPRVLALETLFFLDGLAANWLRDRRIDMPAAWQNWINARLAGYQGLGPVHPSSAKHV